MRLFPALPADHWLVTDRTLCTLCKKSFKAGDVTTLIPPESNDADSRFYSNRVHAACAHDYGVATQ